MQMQLKHVIFAAHPDDELIGAYEILSTKKNIAVIYFDISAPQERRDEALKLKEFFDIKFQAFSKNIPPQVLSKDVKIYAPDPTTEFHPLHREVGFMAEKLLRDNGLEVIFFSTNMLAPYIHEVKEPDKKEEILNKIYPSQRSLWEFEKKYVIFEGRVKWLLN